MIIDKLLSPAINVALSTLTTSAATIGTVMDFGEDRNHGLVATTYGPGWVVTVNGATSGGASTLNLSLVTSDAATLSSPTTLWSRSAIPLTDIDGEGQQFFVPVPSTNDWKRYVALRGNAGTAVFTGGELSFEFTSDFRNYRAYPAVNNR